MRNGIVWFINFLVCIFLVICHFSDYTYSQTTHPFLGNAYSNYKSHRLGVNDTVTIAGSLVSTIKPYLVQDTQRYDQQDTQNFTIDLGQKSELPEHSINFSETSNGNTDSQASRGSLENKPATADYSSSMGDGVNQTDNWSNNFVSMLSEIIIQSCFVA